MRSDYRRALNAAAKKFDAMGLAVVHYTAPSEIARRFDTRLHGYYMTVWNNSRHRMECFPPEFFQRVPESLPGKVVLSIIEQDGTPLAFGYFIHGDDASQLIYVGYDPVLNAQGGLYFNVYQQFIAWAFAHGATRLLLGQTSDETKLRLGAQPKKLCFVARSPNLLINWALRSFASQVFPEVEQLPMRHVFADSMRA